MESLYTTKYKEYIAFLNDNREELLDNDRWDMLFRVLTHLKLSAGYTLDDYRSKGSTNNILSLYARKADTQRPAEEEFERYDNANDLKAIFAKEISGELGNDEISDLPEKISPESVITFDFTADAVWEAYLLLTTNYYIGQRWHGCYHNMIIPTNLEELMLYKPWKENEKPYYEKYITETHLNFEPQITINGNAATIEHLGIFFYDISIEQCRSVIQYNSHSRQIESVTYDRSKIISFSPRFYF